MGWFIIGFSENTALSWPLPSGNQTWQSWLENPLQAVVKWKFFQWTIIIKMGNCMELSVTIVTIPRIAERSTDLRKIHGVNSCNDLQEADPRWRSHLLEDQW